MRWLNDSTFKLSKKCSANFYFGGIDYEKDLIEKQVRVLEEKIDDFVFELYKITNEEDKKLIKSVKK